MVVVRVPLLWYFNSRMIFTSNTVNRTPGCLSTSGLIEINSIELIKQNIVEFSDCSQYYWLGSMVLTSSQINIANIDCSVIIFSNLVIELKSISSYIRRRKNPNSNSQFTTELVIILFHYSQLTSDLNRFHLYRLMTPDDTISWRYLWSLLIILDLSATMHNYRIAETKSFIMPKLF